MAMAWWTAWQASEAGCCGRRERRRHVVLDQLASRRLATARDREHLRRDELRLSCLEPFCALMPEWFV